MAYAATEMIRLETKRSRNITVLLMAFFATCAGTGYFFLPALSDRGVQQPWCALLAWITAGIFLRSRGFVILLICSGFFGLLLASAQVDSAGLIDALLRLPEVASTEWSKLPFFVALFFFLFVPCIFVFGHLNFFDLPNELRRLRVPRVLRTAILYIGFVAAFRSRFVTRAEAVMACLHARGVEMRGWHRKAATIAIWMIPLVRSSLIEGSDRHALFEMLRVSSSAILDYQPSPRLVFLSLGQRLGIVIVTTLLLARMII